MPTDLESFEVSIKAPKDLMLKLGDGKMRLMGWLRVSALNS